MILCPPPRAKGPRPNCQIEGTSRKRSRSSDRGPGAHRGGSMLHFLASPTRPARPVRITVLALVLSAPLQEPRGASPQWTNCECLLRTARPLSALRSAEASQASPGDAGVSGRVSRFALQWSASLAFRAPEQLAPGAAFLARPTVGRDSADLDLPAGQPPHSTAPRTTCLAHALRAPYPGRGALVSPGVASAGSRPAIGFFSGFFGSDVRVESASTCSWAPSA